MSNRGESKLKNEAFGGDDEGQAGALVKRESRKPSAEGTGTPPVSLTL